MNVKIKILDHFVGDLPEYKSLGASGADVRARLKTPLTLAPFGRALVPTGLAFEIPSGIEIQVRPRSGLALKKALFLLNSPGTIDSDYRGELKIILSNLSNKDVVIADQERIAQIVLCPVLKAKWVVEDTLKTTQRGDKGFGSTGVK